MRSVREPPMGMEIAVPPPTANISRRAAIGAAVRSGPTETSVPGSVGVGVLPDTVVPCLGELVLSCVAGICWSPRWW